MLTLTILTVIAFVMALWITPVVRSVFHRLGVLDHPGERKLHSRAVPRVGGVAILVAYVIAFGCVMLVHPLAAEIAWRGHELATRLVPAALLIFIIGFSDDVWDLKPWQKLLGEVFAAVIAYMAGLHVHSFAGYQMPDWLNLPLTVLWLVICTNAVNLIDGVDGLAAGVGLFATCTTLFAALLQNNMGLAFVTAPLAGCLLGFLRYNFNPATIFLGDCGSLFIGFMLGCFGILWDEKSATILGMTAPLMALAIPLLDTSLAIIRRFLRKKPVFKADRGHIHHRLLDRGLTPRKVALLLYGFCAFGAICSLLTLTQNTYGIVIVIFCVVTWIGIQHLGYVEFGAAGRMFIDGVFQRMLNSQVLLQIHEIQLNSASSPDRCWEIILGACKEAGFCKVEMELAGRSYVWKNSININDSWNISIPITNNDSIELAWPFESETQMYVIAPFADLLRRSLVIKAQTFARNSRIPPEKVRCDVDFVEGVSFQHSVRGD